MSESRVRQSDLKLWARCPLQYKYTYIDKQPRLQSGSLTFGSIMHDVVLWMEVNADLETAIERFHFYWDDPTRLDAEYRIDYYVKGTNWRRYQEKGPQLLRDWWHIIQWDTALVLGREFTFTVPIGDGHELHGTIDKLEIAYYAKLNTYVVKVSDYKTNNKTPTYGFLEEDLQFSAYCYATTLLAFWEQLCVANGWPAEQAQVLFDQYKDLPRRGEWVTLTESRRMDAGERIERHYNRLIMAVDALGMSVAMRIFVPNISGESCLYCLGGETEFWTAEGVKTLKEAAGTEQMVLSRGRSGGIWTPAQISSFGVQELRTIVMKRGKASRTIRATPDHRWFVRTRTDPARTEAREVTTSNLVPGDTLLATLPRPRTEKVAYSPIGVQAGVVFGDGCQPVGRQHSVVTLHGAKRSLMPYFEGHATSGSTIHGLPKFLKAAPDVHESASYLLGWLMGYMATDGSVSKAGQVTLTSAKREHLELARTVAARIGIGTQSITSAIRLGFGQVSTPLYRVGFVNSTLTRDFFLLDHHRERFVPRSRSEEKLEWTVVEVRDDGDVEEVFCATVPEGENFTLEGWINTHNCDFRNNCGMPAIEENR